MKISSETPIRTWTFGPKKAQVTATFRPMTALDDDIAIQSAVKWFGELVTSTTVQDEFGLPKTQLDETLVEIQAALDDVKSYSRYLYAVALAVRLISKIDGLTLDEIAAHPSRRTFAILFRDRALMDGWLKTSQKPFHAERSAGNA